MSALLKFWLHRAFCVLSVSLLSAALLAACKADIRSGIFKCDPGQPRDCPDDFVCRAKGSDPQTYCYASDASSAPGSGGRGSAEPDGTDGGVNAGGGGRGSDGGSGSGAPTGGAGGSGSSAGRGGGAGTRAVVDTTGWPVGKWDETEWDESTFQ